MNVSSVKNSQETVFQNCKRKENTMQKTPAGRDFFRPAGKKKKTSGLVRQSVWGQRGQAGRTTRRWISPSSLKSWMVATARM